MVLIFKRRENKMENKNQFIKLLSIIVAFITVAAMGFTLTACEGIEKPNQTIASNNENSLKENNESTPGSVYQEGMIRYGNSGDKEFVLCVTDIDGNCTRYYIKTDKSIVGEALKEHNLIEGEEGPYGLFIKKVCGMEADYDKNKTYWAFYIDGQYATEGIDKTEIINGCYYDLIITKS